jgi:hypothetical protein
MSKLDVGSPKSILGIHDLNLLKYKEYFAYPQLGMIMLVNIMYSHVGLLLLF